MSAEWTFLRAVGSTLPARVTVLFPVVSNLVIFNDYIVRSYKDKQVIFKFLPNIAGDFDSYLFYIFVGLFIFSIGEIFYTLFCPPIIKKYDTPDEFLMAVKDGISKTVILSWAREVEISSSLSDSEKSEEGVSAAISVLENAKFDIREMNDQVVNVARLHYVCKCRSHLGIRFFVFFCFGSGILMMFVPSAKTIFSAAKIIIQ